MTSFTIRETDLERYPILVTWSDYELDFSCYGTLDEALEFIRKNPDIKSLRSSKESPGGEGPNAELQKYS